MSGVSLIATRLALAGLSNCLSSCLTNPIDVIKIRLQLQSELAGAPAAGQQHYSGMLSGMVKIGRVEGIRGLYRGLIPSLLRESSYSSIRVGLYDVFRDLYSSHLGGTGAAVRFLSGATSGCIGAIVANPTDLVKVRLQASRAAVSPSVWGTFRSIVAQEGGIAALWQGTEANVGRAALVTAVQVGSYDQIKSFIKHAGIAALAQEGFMLHWACAMTAGLLTAIATSPVDVAKTRLMNQGPARLYTSTLDCMRKTAQAEGVKGLFKGFTANWMRLGPHTVISFLAYEQLRKACGLPPV
jgi:hypothetical protein